MDRNLSLPMTRLYDDFPPSLTVHDFGSHTYSFYANNERACVKFHFRTQQVIQNLTPRRAQQFLAAFTPRSVVPHSSFLTAGEEAL
jgi:Catalase